MSIYRVRVNDGFHLVLAPEERSFEEFLEPHIGPGKITIENEPLVPGDPREKETLEKAEVNKAYRVYKARVALSPYNDEDESTNITDLLTDLMHAASINNDMSFEDMLDEARGHFRKENNQ